MVAKRIIPCLDVKDGRTVKGVNFVGLTDIGDPVELAVRYNQEGADELVFLDIAASKEGKKVLIDIVHHVAAELSIPFTVGGGVQTVSDASRLLEAGADKISINSAAVQSPELVDALSREFGSQCVVVAIDSRIAGSNHKVFVKGGSQETSKETITWCKEVSERGAGEILLTSMDHDGTKAGYAVELTSLVSNTVTIPVIASGGAGKRDHFLEIFVQGSADAALAAGLFHRNELLIKDLKCYLAGNNIEVRND